MKLHPALRPWESQLGEISPELEGLLAAWLPRLTALIGPTRHTADPELGEPDGFHGFARRGPPDRLILSEWALQQEHPDEFIRRAVDGEQLYLDPARRSALAARRALVLFDTGLEQLGAARLAQLALLVVLGRRAAEGGGVLSWAALPQGGLIRTLDLPGDLAHLASARSWAAGAWDPEPWRERLAAVDDLFVVGGPGAGELADALGARFLAVAEEGETVVVRMGRRGRAARLPISSRVEAASALSAPIGRSRPTAPKDVQPARRQSWFDLEPRTLLFSPSGGHLIAEARGERCLVAFAIGRRGRKSFRPKRRYLRQGEVPLAASVHKGRLVVVCQRDGHIAIDGRAGARMPRWEPGVDRPIEPMVVEGSRAVWVDRPAEGPPWLARDPVLARDAHPDMSALSLARGPRGARALGILDGALHLVDLHGGSAVVERHPLGAGDVERACLGWLQYNAASAYAFEEVGGWRVGTFGSAWQSPRTEARPVHVDPSEDEVLGVAAGPGDLGPALIVLGRGRRLVARRPGGEVFLWSFGLPPFNVSVCPVRPRIAAAMPDGSVRVHDLHSGEIELEIVPGSRP